MKVLLLFLTIQLENERSFIQGASKNIFCYDFDVFNQDSKGRKNVQPWSMASISTVGFI